MANQLPGDPDELENRRLNIFALPSQTAILTGIIIFVVYGAMLGLTVSSAPFPVGWFLFGLFVLSLRNWIAWPERIQRQYPPQQAPQPAGGAFPALQALIHECSLKLGLTRVPILMLVEEAKPFTYGGWRRRYILIGREQAQNLEAMLTSYATSNTVERAWVKAILFHELHHYKHGDNQWLGYTEALLWTGFKFIGWALLFVLGWTFLLELTKPDLLNYTPDGILDRILPSTLGSDVKELFRPLMPSLAEWQAAQQAARRLNIPLIGLYTQVNLLPLALYSGLLALFLWRKLMRFREFYADAGVAHTQHTSAYIWDSAGLVDKLVDMDAEQPTLPRWRRWQAKALLAISPENQKNPAISALIAFVGNLFSFHPSSERRVECLRDPQTMYDPWWKTACLIGLFTLTVDILLTGTSLVLHVSNWPMHFPVLSIFILLSLTLIVSEVIGRDTYRDNLKIIGICIGLRTLVVGTTVIFLLVGSALFPVLLTEYVIAASAAITAYTGFAPMDPFNIRDFAIEAAIKNLTQLVVVGILIVSATRLQLHITQHMLTWYSFPKANRRLMRTIYASMILISCVLAFGILPLLTDVTLWRWANLLSFWRWSLALVMLLLGCVGYAWFIWQDRRYRYRCPACHEQVPGRYRFTNQCDKENLPDHYTVSNRCDWCAQPLHPWLATYYTED